jgi:thiol-disulfide isomerase/thioredoxin
VELTLEGADGKMGASMINHRSGFAAFFVAFALTACSSQGAGSPDGAPPDPNAAGQKRVVQLFKTPATTSTFTATDLDGRPVAPAKGKVVLLNFWATWCGPCRAEIPELVKLQDKYKDYLQIIGVSMDDAAPAYVKQFAAEFNVNYPIVMATPEIGNVFRGVVGLPTTFVLDQETRVVQKHVGLVNPSIFEDETRALAGLSLNASIERIDDPVQVKLANAAQATSIPGIAMENVASGKKSALLKELNETQCTCGCGLTIAACRINDPECPVSLPLAQKMAAPYMN